MNPSRRPGPRDGKQLQENQMSSKQIAEAVLVTCLVMTACHRKPARVALRPPVPTKLEIGNNSFDAGQYLIAAQSYEAYLKENPGAADRDQALFRLGIIYGLSGNGSEDITRAEGQFRALVSQFPQSRFKPEAEYILSLQTEVEKLRLNLRKNTDDLESKDIVIKDQDEKLRDRDDRIKDRDEKIRRLTQELERLKKIDLERRPSHPPE